MGIYLKFNSVKDLFHIFRLNPISKKRLHQRPKAQQNTHNKFLQHVYEIRDDFLEFCGLEGEEADNDGTKYNP
ncbi:hypothetical protein [Cellulophaga sp. F20128]|uniref:hypothetical protein n=1 Tax=Cellulophaga sp. F20128 TaxID=2926413 RepID=UPI0032B1048F